MLDVDLIVAWLRPLFPNVKFTTDVDEDQTDLTCIVGIRPGLGPIYDGAGDQPAFGWDLIGSQNDDTGPDQLAGAIDYAILSVDVPHVLWGPRCIEVSRQGSGPRPGPVPDNSGRVRYSCDYQTITVGG